MFIHLHNHSHYSILEGLPKPHEYVKKAAEYGMTAVALTDTGNIHGCHEFYKACIDENIKPILGAEIYVQSSLDSELSHKIVLLAKSLKGYRNIIALISKANLNSDGRVAQIQFDDMKEYSSDIICLSGPISGEIPYYILAGKTTDEVCQRIQQYQAVFGKENFFLELMYHEDIPKQKFITDTFIELNKNHGIPVVATQNCFYIDKEDRVTQDIIQALGTGHEMENPDRPTLLNGDYSFSSEEDMQILFGFIPEALENTNKIADMVDIQIDTGGILIPTYELPEADQEVYKRAQNK